uniref:hypothetical protein n=1 Tax=Neisseria sp. TaxID=192066 RepID=UPI0035A16FA0
MLIAFKLNWAVLSAALYALALGAGNYAHASGYTARLDDFQPNCDVRPLGLSVEQSNELRNIRKEYKKALDKPARKDERVNRNRRRTIIKLLSDDKFDHDNARDYVETRYISSMDLAVDE